MKRIGNIPLASMLVLVLTAGLAACATGPRQQGPEAVSSSMDQVEQNLTTTQSQVDYVDSAIDDLARSAATEEADLQRAFEEYTSEVARMEEVGEELASHADAMREQGASYFEDWRTSGEEISDPEVRGISDERHAQSRDAFDEATRSSVDVKRALQTYISDLRDIETFLSNDLTPSGVEAITPVIEQAQRDGAALQEAIDPMKNALNRARTGMGIGALETPTLEVAVD